MSEKGELITYNAPEVRNALQTSLYPGAHPDSIDMVLAYCKASRLDPMKKPVHIVPMWDNNSRQMRDVIMPGIGLYRTDAARTGEFAGITEPEFGPMITERIGSIEMTYPEWCKITVSRRLATGEIATFTALEYWIENYAIKGGKDKDQSPNAMWSKRPRGQLAKCTEAQAIRKGFPEAVGSAPTAEEMEGRELHPEPIQGTLQPVKPEPYTDDEFEEKMKAWGQLVADKKQTPAAIIAMVGSKKPLTDEQKAAITKLGETE